jgi:2-polyprenyl-6-hydroxyphenyl methylase / 3-demethylubiquinone-9 3-methyltransferase
MLSKKVKAPLVLLSRRMTSTVIAEEVAKFRPVGEDWWKAKSKKGTGPLHYMNPVRIGYIRDILSTDEAKVVPSSQSLRDLRILDVGCGGGLAAEALARLGASVIALDASEENIQVARNHARLDPTTSSIEYMHSTIESLREKPEYQESFDAVLGLEVIEHIDNIPLFLESCAACLKNGGTFILSTINRTPESYITAIIGAEHILRILPPGTHDWNKFLTPNEMRAFLADQSLHMHDVTGLVAEPSLSNPGSNWTLDPTNVRVNYILAATKLM